MWSDNNISEVSCSLVSLILLENNLEFTSENFEKILLATNVKIESFWYTCFFTKFMGEKIVTLNNSKSDNEPIKSDKADVDYEKIEKKETKIEKIQESDEDMGFGLFD
jgi:ribosomal protein L12E/L44/L45/RPP1/RPP2